MYYVPKHAVPREQHQMRNRVAGVAVAGSATLVTGVGMSGPAEATVWDRVAACESSGNWHINTGNGYFGGLQFLGTTWTGFGGRQFAARADLATKAEQITVAKRVLIGQGARAWECASKAGLTRANGLAAPVGPIRATVSRSKTRVQVRQGAVRPARAPGALAVDSIVGPLTTRATQRWVGVTQDGVFGPRTTRALQRKVGARVDGVIGAATIQALQGKIGARRDGAQHLNVHTAKALQKFLNAR